MSFMLLEEDTLWKKVETLTGAWDNGVWKDTDSDIDYEELVGIVDPYSMGETSFTLPSGVGNTDSYLLFSNEELVTHKSLPEGSTLADVVYLKDPTTSTSLSGYVVYDKGSWSGNGGFMLMDGFYEYLIIREGLI